MFVLIVRSAYGEAQLNPELLREFLQRLIPVWLMNCDQSLTIYFAGLFFFFPNILVLLLDFIVKYGLCQRRWVSYWCWGKSYLCGFGNYYWNWNLIFSIFIFLFFSAGGWLTTRQGSGAHNFVLHFSFLTFFYVTVVDSHVLLTLVLWIPCLQDIRPRFHSSRFHGSDDMNDDVWFYILNWMLDFVFGRLYSLPSHNLTSK